MKKLFFSFILCLCFGVSASVVFPPIKTICDSDNHCIKQICDGDFCHDINALCPKNRPLKLSMGLCVSCEDDRWGSIVRLSTDCDVCPNRKVVEHRDTYRCILKNPPHNKPLVLKYGYKSCGYCVNEEDIIDCSQCLQDYEIIDGRCKKKEGRPCFQA